MTLVTFDLSQADFSAKLRQFAAADTPLHDTFLDSLAHATGMDWEDFQSSYSCRLHSSPHFTEPKVWGDFQPPGLPVHVYAAFETANDSITGHITPLTFWLPTYLR